MLQSVGHQPWVTGVLFVPIQRFLLFFFKQIVAPCGFLATAIDAMLMC